MTVYQLDPADRLDDGGLIIPWPGAQVGDPGDVVAVEIGDHLTRARIRWARLSYTIADRLYGD